MEKLEELARALFEAASSHNGMSFASYADMPEAEKELCRIEVRATLSALLPPSKEMVEAAVAIVDDYSEHMGTKALSAMAFTAMIEAVLK